MYKTVSIWVLGDGEKLDFQTNSGKHDAWMFIEKRGDYSGSTSLHFDKAGLDQLIAELKVLQGDMEEAEDEMTGVLPKGAIEKEEVVTK